VNQHIIIIIIMSFFGTWGRLKKEFWIPAWKSERCVAGLDANYGSNISSLRPHTLLPTLKTKLLISYKPCKGRVPSSSISFHWRLLESPSDNSQHQNMKTQILKMWQQDTDKPINLSRDNLGELVTGN